MAEGGRSKMAKEGFKRKKLMKSKPHDCMCSLVQAQDVM